MIQEKILLDLHEEGFIPGPKETLKEFFDRAQKTRMYADNPPASLIQGAVKVLSPQKHWARARIKSIFDLSLTSYPCFYAKKGLFFFQGAATWQISNDNDLIPLVQLHPSLEKGSYLGIYNQQEIISHEAVHAARIAFHEPKFEEIFAYMTSTSRLRKVLGPLFESQMETLIFFAFLLIGLFSHWTSLFVSSFTFPIFSLFGSISLFSYLIYLLVRLAYRRYQLQRAYNSLYSLLFPPSLSPPEKDISTRVAKKNIFSILLRLTDGEIVSFGRMSKEEILDYISESKDKEPRWLLLYQVYFRDHQIISGKNLENLELPKRRESS